MLKVAASIISLPAIFIGGLFSACAGQSTDSGTRTVTRTVGSSVETYAVVPFVVGDRTAGTLTMPERVLTAIPPNR